jgi:hypothetical protein
MFMAKKYVVDLSIHPKVGHPHGEKQLQDE